MTCMEDIPARSPLRSLESAIQGGLGRGNLGVVCGAAGAGKTAFLVALGLDALMRGRKALHVALDQPVERVRNYYDEIFAQIAREENIETPVEARIRVERNRRIHTYLGHTFSIDAFGRALSFSRTHADMQPDLILLDGYDWIGGNLQDVESLKKLAAAESAELWMSATCGRKFNLPPDGGSLEPVGRYQPCIDVLLRLADAEGAIHVQVLRDHGEPVPANVCLDLDPTTLLLVKR